MVSDLNQTANAYMQVLQEMTDCLSGISKPDYEAFMNYNSSPVKTRELHSHHVDSTIWNDLNFRDVDIVIAKRSILLACFKKLMCTVKNDIGISLVLVRISFVVLISTWGN